MFEEPTYLERLYRQMMEQGYLIQSFGNRYALVTTFKTRFNGIRYFDSYEEALEKVEELLGPPWGRKEPAKLKFTSIVRFDKGLGPQCQTLREIEAYTIEQAEAIAQDEATKLLGEDEWLEIKTRPA